MGLYQSFSQVFVTNSPALLAQGKTVDSLAVGQIDLLDAKTYKAVTTPTYAKNKALYAVWGTPNLDAGEFSGVPNENEYSKIIKGKLIKKIRAKKAKRGQTPLYTVGWSGDVVDTNTLSANVGESKSLFVKLSGTIIDRLYSKQGIIKQFTTTPPCVTDCDSSCSTVDAKALALELVDQINSDKDFKKFIRAKALISCESEPEVDTISCYKFKLTICDTGDDAALGIVQAQYPNETVERISRDGSLSTYGVVKAADSAPADFTSTGVFITDCTDCPIGYTYVASAKVYQVKTATTVSGANVASAFTGEVSVTQVSADPSFNIFLVTFATSASDATVIAAGEAAGYIVTPIGVQSAICTETTPSETEWVDNGEGLRQAKTYTITLADSVCGTTRLAALQAAYPDLVVTLVNAAGDCVHTYETTTYSNCYEEGCAREAIVFTAPAMFEGVSWVASADAPGTNCKTGIQLETSFFNVRTNECTFDSFPYENDIVHIQISNYNPDFNASPCEDEWVVKQIRQVEFPQGHGAYVQHLEKESKQYDQRFRSSDPVVREVQGYSLQADPTKYYDQYVVEYDTKFLTSGGWSESYTQSIHLNFFVPEGTGSALELALNSYVSSAGLDEDGIAI